MVYRRLDKGMGTRSGAEEKHECSRYDDSVSIKLAAYEDALPH